ncbi:unnamed protein product, partial [Ixodes pacificus]
RRIDTIFALATPRGKSGVAVVRISGCDAIEALPLLGVREVVVPRVAAYVLLRSCGEPIDQAIVLYFPGPNSFTGEDVVELQIHGSLAVIRVLFRELQKRFRIAEPGEFSLRAFLNHKMDLTKAEGIADLINAETEVQLRQAFAQVSGSFERFYEKLRADLLDVLSDLEACIDFPDDLVCTGILETACTRVAELRCFLERYLDDRHRGEVLKDGVRVALIGAPNVGKSTLFNFLVRRDMAIVSEYPGTTRDVLEARVDIGGYPFVIVDTAGIRESEHVIEKEGIRRAQQELANADIKVLMFSGDPNSISRRAVEEVYDDSTIYVLSKVDNSGCYEVSSVFGRSFYPISVHCDSGIDALLEAIQEKAKDSFPQSDALFITSQRHRGHLQRAVEIMHCVKSDLPVEIVAEYLRLAAQEVGRVTGVIHSEDILSSVFKKFCVGK